MSITTDEKAILFSARAKAHTEPAVFEAVNSLRAKGLKDRQILNILCQQYTGWDGTDDMVIDMPAGVLRRYLIQAVSAAVEKLIPIMLEQALEHVQFSSGPNGSQHAGPSGDVQPEIKSLIGFFETNPDDDDEDSDEW